MTKMTQKYTELLLNWTEQALKWSNFKLFYMYVNTEHMVTILTKNWQKVEIFT